MLCNLALQHAQDGSYILRVSGKTALGPSGTGGRDTKELLTADALLAELEALGLGRDVLGAAVSVSNNPRARNRFITFAEDVQISFDMLGQADIHLFD